MKKRYVPIITFSFAILLVGSIVYASYKRKKARLIIHEPSEMSEEALKSELLAGSENQHEKSSGTKAAKSSKSADTAKVKVK